MPDKAVSYNDLFRRDRVGKAIAALRELPPYMRADIKVYVLDSEDVVTASRIYGTDITVNGVVTQTKIRVAEVGVVWVLHNPYKVILEDKPQKGL